MLIKSYGISLWYPSTYDCRNLSNITLATPNLNAANWSASIYPTLIVNLISLSLYSLFFFHATYLTVV